MKRSLSFTTIITGIFGNRCPFCSKGRVFTGIYAMNRRCSECERVFEKEPGYFLGAIVVAYFFGAFSVIPTIVISHFVLNLEISSTIGLAILQLLLLQPLLYRYSKLTWLYVEGRMTDSLGP